MARRGRPDHIDGPDAFARAFSVSRETIGRLQTYADLLAHWQKAVNLVAPSTLDDVWHRHFADSAQLSRWIPASARMLADLGSGAGFPGLVLAILLAERGAPAVTLVESDTRKAAFLREVARVTGTSVDIVAARIENPETHATIGTVDVVTVRALAPLPSLLRLAAPYFAADAIGLFLKGRGVLREIEGARADWRFSVALHSSATDAEGRVAVIGNLTARTEG
jgi:16S rRNA (guanine527-N7)-methyltransferase